MNTLKQRIVLCFALLTLGIAASAQIEFLDKFRGNKDVNIMSINKQMLALIGTDKINLGDGNIGDLVNKVDEIHIVNTTNPKAAKKLTAKAAKAIKKYKYSTVMSGKDDEMGIDIHFLNTNAKSYLIIQGAETKELNLIIMTGSFTLEDLSNLVNSDD